MKNNKVKKNDVVLVTGASVGIGKAICETYLENKNIVIGVARRGNLLDKMAKKYPKYFFPVECDICDTEKLIALINKLPYKLKDITILINNAGLAQELKPVQESSLDDFKKILDLNVYALVNLTQKISVQMSKNNFGHIVNISSVAGNIAYYGGNLYCSSKAFVTHFSKALRCDLVKHNIRVTNIEPGLVGDTEFSIVRYKGDKQKAAATYKDCDFLLAEDIAKVVYFTTQMPGRVNISNVEILASSQTEQGYKVTKNSERH